MTTAPVEVLRRPEVPNPGQVPPEIIEHFKAMGRHVNLIYADSRNLAMQRGYGRESVLIDDFPSDELKKIARRAFDPPERNYGELRRGDCLLVSQPIELRDQWRGEENRILLEQEEYRWDKEAEALTEEVARKAAENGAEALGVPSPKVVGKKVPSARDHVMGGTRLANEIENSRPTGG